MFAVVSFADERFVQLLPTREAAVQWALDYIRDNYEEGFGDLEAAGYSGEEIVEEFEAQCIAPLDRFSIEECRMDQSAFAGFPLV